jgi:hypothetical protein
MRVSSDVLGATRRLNAKVRVFVDYLIEPDATVGSPCTCEALIRFLAYRTPR